MRTSSAVTLLVRIEQVEQSLALYREADDAHGIALALEFAGLLAQEQDDYKLATAYLSEALEISRSLADWEVGANLLTLLGLTAQFTGDLQRAANLMQESLRLARVHDDVPRIVERLSRLASVQLDFGNLNLARQLTAEALAIVESSEREIAPWTRVVVLHNHAAALRRSGDVPRALELQESTLQMLQSLGSPGGWTATVILELAYGLRQIGDPARAASLAAQSVRLAREVGDRRGTAAALEGLAAVFASAGVPASAIPLILAAKMLRFEMGAPIPPSEARGIEQIQMAGRDALGDAGFHRAASNAEVVSLDEIITGSLALVSEISSGDRVVVPETCNAGGTPPKFGLTAREQEVLVLLVEGHSNPEIAARLFISQKTVRNHLTNVYSKLGVESRTAAATLALRRGLV